MAKLTITLKQHTPIIHFQSEQEGATIRATEFKPKLDKFLEKCVFENFEQYKQYLIGYKSGKEEKDFKGKKNFNYKLKFSNVINKRDEKIKKKFPFYLSNISEDGNKDNNKFVFCDSVEIEIFSLKEDLIKKIKDILPLFLMKHNFGQRQSKGFGSFFINDELEYYINGKKANYDKSEMNQLKLRYSIKIEIKNGFNNISSIICEEFFKELERFYSNLRRSIGKRDPYIKEFALTKGKVWDKKAIKERFAYSNMQNIRNAILIKDLLGLSVDELWMKQNFKVKKEHISLSEEDKIDRMQSPIFFKPIMKSNGRFIVYFEGREIPEKFLNQKFKITKNLKDGNRKYTIQKDEFQLITPESFDVNEFIEFVIAKDNRWNINKL